MVKVRDAEGKVVMAGRNLGCILRYMRSPLRRATRVDIWENKDGSAQLGVCFADGATTITDFNSFAVCKQWVASRKGMAGADVHIHTREGVPT